MNEIIYLVYDGNELVGGFVSLAVAVDFAENWRLTEDAPVHLVDAHTGEVVDTWVNSRWENGDY